MFPMKIRSLLTTALTLVILSPIAMAELVTETIDYEVEGESFTGYLSFDQTIQGQRPGILIIHEWWGHNDFVRKQADRLAREGYTAFALDMYGSGKVADHPDDAQQFAQQATADDQKLSARLDAALALLREHETVDAGRIAAQGYCFGGTIVLSMARSGADLKGVVSYHGSLGGVREIGPAPINARVLVFTGGADPMVPPEQVANFVREMQEANADLTLVVFPNATHSFTNPEADSFAERFDMPVAYDPDAAERSWRGTLNFYAEIFSQKPGPAGEPQPQ